MKVILLKDVPKVGQKNTIKEVKDGFAINLLIPRGLAKQATPSAVHQMEKIQTLENKNKKAGVEALEEKVSGLDQIEIKVKANEKGHLFAGIGKDELSNKLDIPAESIILDSPIKEVGEHEIEVKIGEQTQKIKVVITQE